MEANVVTVVLRVDTSFQGVVCGEDVSDTGEVLGGLVPMVVDDVDFGSSCVEIDAGVVEVVVGNVVSDDGVSV